MQLRSGDDHASGRSESVTVPGEPSGRSPFADAVLEVLATTRSGEVLTYAEVAAEAGHPGAARAVGRVLRTYGAEVAWWRVVTASGRLVPHRERAHAQRLASEGVPATDLRERLRGRARRAAPIPSAGRAGPGADPVQGRTSKNER